MLTIARLSKTYANGVRALQGVNLTIGSGLFGLLGPNGAGKSTLMRTIAALQEPDEGEILFDGRNIVEEPRHVRHQLGYLPQDFGVYPGVSALHLLDHLAVLKGITNRSERAEQVDALLHLTNLHEVRKKDVSTFSGGMKQRFGIAQALLGSPRLLIVDEPTAGLDPEERNRFHNLLSEVGENVVVILSTHIVEDVRDLCPKMAILADGRILLEGEPTRLMDQLEGRIWRKIVSKAELAEYRATQPVLSTHHFGGKIRLHVLADACPGSGFERISPGLEDVYFSVLTDRRTRGEAVAC